MGCCSLDILREIQNEKRLLADLEREARAYPKPTKMVYTFEPFHIESNNRPCARCGKEVIAIMRRAKLCLDCRR